MSTRCQPTPRWGWLLLIGGLTACGYDTPWASGQAAASPAGGVRTSETETEGGSDTLDPDAGIGAMGVFEERFVNKGYGMAWSVQTEDLDGDGVRELIYGGNAVVAKGRGEEPLWTFELPAVEEAYVPGRRDADEPATTEEPPGRASAAEKFRFMGVHVREIRASEGGLFVLDSADRIHLLDGKSGKLVYTVALQNDGNACDFALIDADGDGALDFFPSGGVSAYSGKTGQKVWEADIGFTPTSVKIGNLDADPGADLLLVGSSGGRKGHGICPAEMNALMAIHDGMELVGPGHGRDDPAVPRPGLEDGREERRSKASIAAVNARGETLYESKPASERIGTTALYDLDGDGVDDVILGTSDGLVVLDRTGTPGEAIPIEGRIDHVFAMDLENDGRRELIASAYANNRTTLYAYGPDGQAGWNAQLEGRAYTIEALDLNGDGVDELVTGLGYSTAAGEKYEAPTIAWSVGTDGPTELWRFGTAVPANGYVAIEGDMAEGNRLYIASDDARITAVAADSGRVLDSWSAGGMNHAVATGDLDGDGMAETITGDVYGEVSVIGSGGERIFDGTLASEGPAVVTGIDVAPTESGVPGYFVVSGYAWKGENAGVLQAFDADGNTLFAVTTPHGMAKAKFADLNGDGVQEIVVPHFSYRLGSGPVLPESPSSEESCGVMAYDLDGKLLWDTEVASCDIAQLAVGDIDGNGTEEVAYGDLGRSGPYHLALLDGDGTVRWNIASERDDTVWLEIVEGGVAYGGRSGEDAGHVTVRAANDGMERWRVDAGGEAADAPEMAHAPFGNFSGSLFGQKLDDVNGDGIGDLAYTTMEGMVRLVDGANGEPIWEGSLADARYPAEGGSLVGGPLAYVPGPDGRAGLLVVTAYDFRRFGSEAFAFELDTGNVVGNIAFDDLAVGVGQARWIGGEGVVITTSYDTYGLSIGEPRGDRPRPGRGGYESDLNID